jgi:hypothetical protein
MLAMLHNATASNRALCIADATAVSDANTSLHERYHVIASVRFSAQALVDCCIWMLRVYSCGDVYISTEELNNAQWLKLQAATEASVKATVAFYESGNELDEHTKKTIGSNNSAAVQQALVTVSQIASRNVSDVRKSPEKFQNWLLQVSNTLF